MYNISVYAPELRAKGKDYDPYYKYCNKTYKTQSEAIAEAKKIADGIIDVQLVQVNKEIKCVCTVFKRGRIEFQKHNG